MKSTTDKFDDIIQGLATKYRYFLVDLDNTLYNENDYLFGAYRSISIYLRDSYGINAEKAEQFLVDTFNKEGRHLLFNRLCAEFTLGESAIEEMLRIMRDYQPTGKMSLYPTSVKLLKALSDSRKDIFIVTNGNLQQQQNKVRNIDWGGLGAKIEFVYTAKYQPKPAIDSFNQLVKTFGITVAESIMIGDTETDEAYAKNCGIRFMHITKLLEAKS